MIVKWKWLSASADTAIYHFVKENLSIMNRKIAFFDIDGTLTSELDGSIPDSAVLAIRKARRNGNLMFINTGRCLQNVEERFRSIGFDGYVCGCGTNIYCSGHEILHIRQSHRLTAAILEQARRTDLDILFESKEEVCFDLSRPLKHPKAVRQYYAFLDRQYDMSHSVDAEDFTCDKFVIWFHTKSSLEEFRRVSDPYFTCIDRGGEFREFVPRGYSKATGIQAVLDYYALSHEDAYAFGDSNNDLPMLQFLDNSVAMGNAVPTSLFEQVSYVTDKASEDGIAHALEHLGFV